MIRHKAKILAALMAGLCVLYAPMPAHAQFLNKLSKGLEKVNKGLDKVNKVLDGQTEEARNKDNGKESAKKSATSSSQSADETSGWKKVDAPVARSPYIDEDTKVLRVKNLAYMDLTSVNEGVFGFKEDGKWEFWTVAGQKLFANDWKEVYMNRKPVFTSGVAVVKQATRDAKGNQLVCLLYIDGSVQELSPEWQKVSNFKDGLALVEARTFDSRMMPKTEYFYINTLGKRVFPSLTVGYASDVEQNMRPCNSGLRACYYKQGSECHWGFIDDKGALVLTGFEEVRDFSDGFAWVIRSQGGDIELIDTKGKTVFAPGVKVRGYLTASNQISDASNGIVKVSKEDSQTVTTYYTVTGEPVGTFAEGSVFDRGHAIVEEPSAGILEYGPEYSIDTDGEATNRISTKILPPDVLAKLKFKPYGLASWRSLKGEFIGNSRGQIFITSNMEFGDFGQFSEWGYATIGDITVKGVDYKGLMTPDGHVAWLFTDNPDVETTVGGDQPPIGPKPPKPATFTVTVKANPAEAGTVSISPAAPYIYGSKVTVTARPNSKEWGALPYMDCSYEDLIARIGEPFTVTRDLELTVNFVKREDEDKPRHTGAYQGDIAVTYDKNQKVPLYAEISAEPDIESPYGKTTHGFIVIMWNPTDTYRGPEARWLNRDYLDVTANIYYTPLLITGEMHDADTGREWLMLDGASAAVGNFRTNPRSEFDFESMILNLKTYYDGLDDISGIPRHYRVEIKDRDKSTGEFTLGTLETYNDYGKWVPGGDKSLEKTTEGRYVGWHDSGYDAATFEGVRLKTAPKRDDVLWYPPADLYDGDETKLESIAKALGNRYRKTRSPYFDMFPPI